MNNQFLLHYHQQIEEWKRYARIEAQFFRTKINQFYKDNAIRVDSMFKRIQELQHEYFVIENEQIKHEGEGKDRKPVCNPEKTREEYDVKYKELMEKEVTIKF